jgi:hypothetical protein
VWRGSRIIPGLVGRGSRVTERLDEEIGVDRLLVLLDQSARRAVVLRAVIADRFRGRGRRRLRERGALGDSEVLGHRLGDRFGLATRSLA